MKNLYNMALNVDKRRKAYIVGTEVKSTKVIRAIEPKEEIEVDDFLGIEDLKVAELKVILASKKVEHTATKKADLIELVKANS